MSRYVVLWQDPCNSVQRKGGVFHNGKSVFQTEEEAREALDADLEEERAYNPESKMTWCIFRLPEPAKTKETEK